MISRKKLCLAAAFCGIMFLMIATHAIHKNDLLSYAVAAAHGVLNPLTNLTRSGTASSRGQSCSCASCVADTGISEWFDQRYDPNQHPYIPSEENSMDPVSLNWWLALQRSSNEKLQDVIHNMFKVISPPAVEVAPQQSKCRRCAVVGNSGNLLQSQYGPLINSHPIIIRMNKATTVGFEADVGSRTTHHFMYPESAVDLSPGVHLVLLPFKLLDLQWITSALSTGEIQMTYMRVKSRVKADKDKVIVVNPAFFKYVHDKWAERHGRYPSTGMLAIIFALHICDEVSVFGYGANEQGNWHHYWEDNKYAGAFRKTGVHNADFEKELILKLSTEGKIKLYRR